MNAVDRKRALALGVEVLGRVEQIDERDVIGPRDLGHGGGVELQPSIVGGAVGQVCLVQILMGDGGEQDDLR